MVKSDDETTTAVEDAVLTSEELSYPKHGVVAVFAAEWVLVFPTAGVMSVWPCIALGRFCVRPTAAPFDASG